MNRHKVHEMFDSINLPPMLKNGITDIPRPKSFGNACLVVLGGFTLFLILRALYNVFLHPLRKFPGPISTAASRLPLTIATIRGEQLRWLQALHENYGHVVRISPDALSYTDERAWSDINGSTSAAKYGMEKDERLLKLIGGDMTSPNPELARGDQKHTQMRKAYASGLTKAAVRSQAPLIVGHVEELLEVIDRKNGEAIDIVDAWCSFVYNIFSDLFLGESLNLFKDPTYVPWAHSFNSFAKATTIMAALQHYVIARYILAFVVQKFGGKKRDEFMKPIFDRFDRRAASETKKVDLLHYALREENKLSLHDLREFSPFLMIGGCETTPNLLSGLVFYLLKNPEYYAEVNKEVRENFKSEEEITIERMFGMPFLEACIQEAFRMYSPIGSGVDRMVPRGGATIAGQRVPENTVVTALHHVTFTASRNFARCNEYIPTRWLPSSDPEFASDRKNSLKPFSVGPQSCFGQDLTFYVTRMVLCRVFWKYDMELCPESRDWVNGQKCWSARIKGPLYVKFKSAKRLV
ncbi:cytochrome P450 [Lentithecium fluviatile CBS 122367]|uniref:Cytochrome P450 n=1 Tax=Lentithecium fluviatile CBS 122367 TaxID=1168545 RepID=A0A6G1J6P8_9PLEO|nr:cytochrome P450 [Lentithecium fluviatile CBS 122367]